MKNYKFVIMTNKYDNSQVLKQKLQKTLLVYKATEDSKNPDIIFVIGGDGTFLQAVNMYNHLLKKVKFVIFKCGKISFYGNFSAAKVEEILEAIATDTDKQQLQVNHLALLKVKINDKIFYAINEVKLVNLITTLSCQVWINNELFETFRGSGLVIATKTGATGLMKALGGAVLLTKHNLMQLQEIAPVANNNYRSLNSPLVLDEKYKITLQKIQKTDKTVNFGNLIIDTFNFNDKLIDKITITLSKEVTLQVLEYVLNPHSLLDKVKKAFIQD